MRKDDLLKCLESLEVDPETAEKFTESLQETLQQMQSGDVRMSHPSLLKLRYLVEEMLGSLSLEVGHGSPEKEYKKILMSSSYSTPHTQAYQDLNDALQIQIEKTKQLLKE